jgi:hypothetical protein
VLAYLKTNLKDLATHYHAQYQNATGLEKLTNYREASQWYGATSSPSDGGRFAPVNYRLADLLSRTRISARRPNSMSARYAPHPDRRTAATPRSTHTEQLKSQGQQDQQCKSAIRSRARSNLPTHSRRMNTRWSSGGADDMYEMKDYRAAIEADERVIDKIRAEAPIRRSAWIVVAHGSFELAEYRAEHAYTESCSHAGRRRVARRVRGTLRPRSTSRVKSQTRRRTIVRPPTTS